MGPNDDEARQQTLLDAVVQRLPAGVVIAEAPSGRIISANPESARILRRTVVHSRGIADYREWLGFHPDGSQYEPDEWPLARSLTGEIVDREDIRIIRGDGSLGVIRASSAPIRNTPDGPIIGAVITFFDVTDETRERDALQLISDASAIVGASQDQEEALREIAELAVPQFADLAFVYLLDENGALHRQHASSIDPDRTRLLEDMWQRFATTAVPVRPVLETGQSQLRETVTDRDWEFIQDPERRKVVMSLGIRSGITVPMMSSGRTYGVIAFALTRSSRRYDEFDLLVAEEIARRAAAAIEKAQLFAAERRAREEAERASRAKDEFLAVLSHELRTPMTTVIGWADLLKMTYGDDPNLAGPVDALRSSAKIQAKLVDDLLDVSRIVTGKLSVRKTDIDLVSIVRAAVDTVSITAQTKHLSLHFNAPNHPLPMRGDPDRLQQTFSNLLVNAIKFTPTGGRIDVTVRRQDSTAEVVVQDTGEGIAPDFLPHVFDRFRQGSIGDSRRHSGLGLGLSIVQHVVQLHGGTVRAESDGVGKGARFTVTLPLE